MRGSKGALCLCRRLCANGKGKKVRQRTPLSKRMFVLLGIKGVDVDIDVAIVCSKLHRDREVVVGKKCGQGNLQGHARAGPAGPASIKGCRTLWTP